MRNFFKTWFRRESEAKGFEITRDTTAGAAPFDLASLFKNKHANSAVQAASRFIRLTLPEAPFTLWRLTADGADERLDLRRTQGLELQAQQLLQLIRRPNPEYGGKLLLAAIAVAVAIDGNGYCRIYRSTFTTPAELRYFPPHCVQPMPDSQGYLSYYRVSTRTGVENVPPADMIHVRNGIDDHDPLRGISDLKAAAREVLGDNKAAEYIVALMTNPAIGLMVAPKTGTPGVQLSDISAIVERLKAKASGAGRFGTVGAASPIEISEFGITPDKMPVGATRQNAVERILSVIGIDPMVLGLPSTNKTYSNLSEARRGAYKSLLIPLQTLIQDEFNHSLVSQFSSLDKAGYWLAFDLAEVKELQEDETARWERLLAAYSGDAITRGEVRTELGFKAEKGRDDVFSSEVRGAVAMAPEPKPLKSLKDRIRDRRRIRESVGIDDGET